MPTEVTPTPFQMASSMGFHPGWSSMPGSGPARAAEIIPCNRAPGSVMPNGLRNPWAPYSGGTYKPSAAAAAQRQENQIAGGTAYGGSVMGGSVMGGGMGGMSVIAPSSVGLGGYREDDGWNGSMGRAHLGHAPDMSSTAGAISQIRAPSAGGWLNQPASWGNHARMTPTIAAGLAGSEIFHLHTPDLHQCTCSRRPTGTIGARACQVAGRGEGVWLSKLKMSVRSVCHTGVGVGGTGIGG
ncbi:hypothetical protein IAT38_004742 [Cryptococcus sp. DSM 104549]